MHALILGVGFWTSGALGDDVEERRIFYERWRSHAVLATTTEKEMIVADVAGAPATNAPVAMRGAARELHVAAKGEDADTDVSSFGIIGLLSAAARGSEGTRATPWASGGSDLFAGAPLPSTGADRIGFGEGGGRVPQASAFDVYEITMGRVGGFRPVHLPIECRLEMLPGDDDAARVVRANIAVCRRCNVRERTEVRVLIAADGSVLFAKSHGDAAACLTRGFSDIAFPKPEKLRTISFILVPPNL